MRHTSPWIAAVAAIVTLPSAAPAADRTKAEVACQPTGESLRYECTIKLSNARTGTPLSKVNLSVGADMPSMPMMHNVPSVKAEPTGEAGTYRVRLELEMTGDWALQLNLSGAVRDRVIKALRFEEERVVESSPPPRRK
jgi:hypothetical protein